MGGLPYNGNNFLQSTQESTGLRIQLRANALMLNAAPLSIIYKVYVRIIGLINFSWSVYKD
jgi:hypothetical protein